MITGESDPVWMFSGSLYWILWNIEVVMGVPVTCQVHDDTTKVIKRCG